MKHRKRGSHRCVGEMNTLAGNIQLRPRTLASVTAAAEGTVATMINPSHAVEARAAVRAEW